MAELNKQDVNHLTGDTTPDIKITTTSVQALTTNRAKRVSEPKSFQ